MSMLSEQCAKLRMLAGKLRNVHARQGDDFVESCETLYWSMCAMHEAADTIEGLRDRLQAESWTCEMVTSGTPCDGNTDVACTSCGAYNIGEYYDGHGHRSSPKYCPECGARRVER